MLHPFFFLNEDCNLWTDEFSLFIMGKRSETGAEKSRKQKGWIYMELERGRKPSFGEALFVLVVDALIISYGVLDIHFESGATFGLALSAHVPLFIAAVFTALVGVFFIG